MRVLSLATLAVLVAAPALHAQTAAASSTPGDAATLTVDARLVVVPVTVRDKKGALVRTLGKDDFTLVEDGKPQIIRYFDRENDLPLTLGLLVDVSGSQRGVLDEERTASSAFLDDLLLPERDKAFVVQFGHGADLLVDVTGALPKLQAGLKKIDGDTDRPQFGGGSGGNSGGSGNGGSSGNGSGSNGGGGGSNGGNGGSGNGNGGSGNGNDRQSTDDRSSDTQNGDGGRGGQGQGGQGRGGQGGGQGGGRRRGGGGGRVGGGTVLYDAVFLSADEVIAKQKTRKALILLTDGDDRGSKESIGSAIEAAQRADAAVYAIYFKGEERSGGFPGGGYPGSGGRRGGGYPGGGGGGYPGNGGDRVDGRKVLERIAGETGGRVFTVSKKEPLADIYRQIAEELRSQYRLGFTPTDKTDGYHKLVVDLPRDRKSFLQAREGYYTGTTSR